MGTSIPLLIVGAGPFGLAVSAFARRHGVEHVIAGEPMGFWKSHMPKGMFLRSGCDWHLDPFGEHTMVRYLEGLRLEPEDVDPLPLDVYLDYCEWFRRQKGIEPVRERVARLDCAGGSPGVDRAGGSPGFEALLESGERIHARSVVLALGFGYFKSEPEPYPGLFPPGSWVHTSDLVDFSALEGKRVLIIGGRQSAFEYAALILEHGAGAVHLSYRHATPAFEPSDWSWVNPIVDSMVGDPGWFRRLTAAEKEAINRRMWQEGRLKLEPWLAARLADERLALHPHTHVIECSQAPGGALDVRLSDGTSIVVERVVLATGYKVDAARIPMLAQGNVLERLAVRNGFPELDDHLQSSVLGLFFTSMCAAQDFGPFFAFTVSVRASARLIGEELLR